MTRFQTLAVGTVILALAAGGAVRADDARRPFEGRGTNTITGASGPTLTATGSGQATQLGRYTRTEALTFSSPVDFTGWVVFVAANGDELRCDMEGQFFSASDAFGTYTIVGGTGRFANATGFAQFKASLTSASSFDVVFDGTLER